MLWLIGEDPGDPGSWPDPLTTLHPPVCSRCARWSARACPHLRQGHALIRVREHELLGVRGTLYRPGHAGPVLATVAGIGFDDPRIKWTLAGQLIMQLGRVTITGFP